MVGKHPAFPVAYEPERHHVDEGLTKREWLAGMALTVVAQYGAIRNYADQLEETQDGIAATVAKWAFEIADAMIQESKKAKPNE